MVLKYPQYLKFKFSFKQISMSSASIEQIELTYIPMFSVNQFFPQPTNRMNYKFDYLTGMKA